MASRRKMPRAERLQMESDREAMMEILALPRLQDADANDAERWFYSLYRSMSKAIEDMGGTPGRYVEHRPSRIEHDVDPRLTWCRQCMFSANVREDSMGHYCECTVRFDGNGDPVLCSHDDGCTFGLRRKEYRK